MRLCLPAMLMFAMPALAEPVDTIVVTGTRLEAPIGTEAYGSVVIARDRLQSSASGRIEDVLRDVAGFQQFRRTDSRSANPTTQGATLRALGGNASSRALVLLDGIPQADPFAGYVPFSALRPERLASARVTRGGGVGAFGAGAVAGTIELESGGPADLPDFAVRAFGGSRDATEIAGGLVQRLGSGFASISAGWDRGDGYIVVPASQRGSADIPARYDAWSVALRAVAPITADMEVQASGLMFDDRRLRGLAGTASRSRGADASVRLIGRKPWGFEALAYVQERGFRSGFVATAADRSSVTPTLDQFATPSLGLGAKIELRPPIGPGASLRFGGDIREASGRTNEFFRFERGLPTRLRRAGGVNTVLGSYVEGSATFGPLVVTGGGRVDRWSIKRGFLTEQPVGGGAPTQDINFADRSGVEPTARGGLLLRVSDALSLRAAAYTGFRVPTLNELYRPFRVGADATAANAELGLEKLRGVEGGLDISSGSATLSLTAFRNRLEGAVANVTLGAGPGVFPQVGFVAAGGAYRQRRNLDAISVDGIEASGSIGSGDVLLSASYAFTDAKVRASGIAAALDGKRPAQSPKHQASATLGFAPESGPRASVTLRYAGTQFEDDLQSRSLPDALTIDAVASIAVLPGLRLVARGENLFDEKIVSGVSATGIEDLGTPRTLWLGFDFALN